MVMTTSLKTFHTETAYIAAGCNRTVNVLDWGSDANLIAYGFHHSIAIYDPHARNERVVATLQGHSDVVTSLQWLSFKGINPSHPQTSYVAALATGAADGTVCIWLIHTTHFTWKLVSTLRAHPPGFSVNSITLHPCVCPNANRSTLTLVTTGGDGDVTIWTTHATRAKELEIELQLESSGGGGWRLEQRLSYGTRLQHCAALTFISPSPSLLPSIACDESVGESTTNTPRSSLLLALGGVDGKVHLLLQTPANNGDNDNTTFNPVCALEGHQNWVRGLSFTLDPRTPNKLLLASASQDRYIRVWAITPEMMLRTHSTGAVEEENERKTDLLRYAPRPRFHVAAAPEGVMDKKNVGTTYEVVLEAMLIGHEDWVQSVAFAPSGGDDHMPPPPLCLLSASMDRTMVLWGPDPSTGMYCIVLYINK